MKIKLKRDRDFRYNGISEIRITAPINVLSLLTKDVWSFHRNNDFKEVIINVDLFDWIRFNIYKLFKKMKHKKVKKPTITEDELISILSNPKHWCPSKKEQWRRMAKAIIKQFK